MRPLVAAVAVLALALSAAGAGSATAADAHGPKVDSVVGLEADVSPASAPIPVIVFGRHVGRGNPELQVVASLSGEEVAGTVTAAQLDRLAAEPNVAWVAPDAPVAPQAAVAAADPFPLLSSLYPVVDGAPDAWAQGYTGAGVGIAIVDSGLDRNAAFGASGRQRVAVTAGANGGNDRFGHGTLVASVAAGQSDDGRFAGIAPGATVVTYCVDDGSGEVSTSDVLRGLAWVLANQQRYDIRVVNLSLAETLPSSYRSSALDAMVETLWRDAGIVVVTAAGNLGPDSADYAPANDPFVLSVGATDANGTAGRGDDALTPWSSFGVTPDGFAKPELVAPGRRVEGALPPGSDLAREAPDASWVALPTYVAISGTSFSAPQVAGAAAVLLQEHPDWTPAQVKWVLTSTAGPVAGSAAGALDLAAAVAYAGTPPAADEGIEPAAFGGSTWVASLLQGDPAGWRQATWSASQQATWTASHQATWTASRQATWTASRQATWTASHQATWTDVGWGP